MAQQLSSPKQAGRVAMSFYAVVICETLAGFKVVRWGDWASGRMPGYRKGFARELDACCRHTAALSGAMSREGRLLEGMILQGICLPVGNLWC